MTLKEKFKQCKNKRNTYYIIPIIEDIEQIEQIAEEFAVKFAEFIDFEYYQHKYRCNTYAESLEDFEIDKTYSVKELLEIFKKEKYV